MMNDKGVLVVGELNLDVILNQISGFPILGQEIIADDLNITLGSSSAIFASNIAALGINTSFCGMIGKDAFGRIILEQLKNKNVNTSLITESEKYQTGMTVVLNYGQDRANVTFCGAMEAFNKSNIPPERLSRFQHLHFSSYFLQKGMKEYLPELFRLAKEKGLTTSLDLQWDPENKWEFPYKQCLPYVDVFLPNEAEILLLTGESSLERAVKLIGEFGNEVVVKQGIKGAVYYRKGIWHYSKPFLHDRFVDAIGAGDSFNAGFLSKYLTGAPIEECLQFGNLAGAVNTTAAGGTKAFESLPLFKKRSVELFNFKF